MQAQLEQPIQLDPRNAESAKQVICGIVAASAGRFSSTSRLYQAFYYAHLFYWMSAPGVLTTYPIIRTSQGLGLHGGDELLLELEREGRLRVTKEFNGPYPDYVYELVGPFSLDRSNPRDRATEDAAEWVRGKTSAELSVELRERSRSWRQGADGQEIDIYIDVMDEREYQDLQRGLDRAEELVLSAFR